MAKFAASPASAAGGSKILRCNCFHVFQDQLHGAGMRVFNRAPKGEPQGMKQFRCSVCKALRIVGKD